MNRKKYAAVILFVFFMSAVLSILQVAGDTEELAIGQCVSLALDHAYGLHATSMQVRAAEAKLAETYMAYLPVVTTGFAYSRLNETDPATFTLPPSLGSQQIELYTPLTDSYGFTVSLRQPLFTGFRLLNNTARQGAVVKAASAEYDRSRLVLINTAEKAYWLLVRAVETRKVMEENRKVVASYLSDMTNFFNQGLATTNDVLAAKMRLSRAEVSVTEAVNGEKLARLSLAILVGADISAQIMPAEPVYHGLIDTSDPGAFMERAMLSRPEIKAISAQVKSAEKEYGLTQAAWYPSVYLSGNLSYSLPNQRYFPPVDEFMLSWDIGVFASMDFSGWYSAPARGDQARARIAEITDTLKQVRDSITMDVMRNLLALEKAAQQIGFAETLLSQSTENARAVLDRYNTGLAGNSELLEADLGKWQAHLALLQARIDYEIGIIDLNLATGTDSGTYEKSDRQAGG